MAIQIPERLKQRGIRFVLLEKSGKRPFQTEWQNKLIEFDNPELMDHLNRDNNYGVLGGGEKQLIIIDFDSLKIQEAVVPLLPKTFTIKTGSGKLHKYFFTDRAESFKIFDEELNTLSDIQGEGKQVVGCNSIHPNGNKYELYDNSEINFLPIAEIKALLIPYDKKPQKQIPKPERINTNVQDDFIGLLKERLSMVDVLSSFGINVSRNPCACPFHSSKGGKCLGFNKETAHCFHCDGSWNIFSFVKEMKKCDFKEALEYLANLAGLMDELEISKRKYLQEIITKKSDEEEDARNSFRHYVVEKKYSLATEVLVDYIKDNNYIYTTKDDQKTEMWIYKDGVYVPQGKSEVKEILREFLGEYYSIYYYNQVINKLEPDTFIDTQEFFKQNYKDEIPVSNGILNLFTRELKEFSPEKIFFNKLPVEFDPKAECLKIERFLCDVLSDEDDRLVFYELGGFCLYKEYNFEKAFMLVGNGRNGKDKSLELIKRLIGLENCCSVPLVSLSPESFIISEFFGKMVNIAGDINNQDLKDTSTFKALTGRSIVSAPRKFLQPITFQNYAKFIFACNDLPMVYDTSKGFWDRWVLLEYPYTFVQKKELIESIDKTNLKLRDEGIIEKITTPTEMSGLLNKFLDGLDRLFTKRTFSSTRGSEEIKNLWIRKSNSFMAFALDNIEDDYESYISKKDLRKKYVSFCKEHKLIAKSDKVIKITLQDMFGVSEERKDAVGITWKEWVWEGIKWKNV